MTNINIFLQISSCVIEKEFQQIIFANIHEFNKENIFMKKIVLTSIIALSIVSAYAKPPSSAEVEEELENFKNSKYSNPDYNILSHKDPMSPYRGRAQIITSRTDLASRKCVSFSRTFKNNVGLTIYAYHIKDRDVPVGEIYLRRPVLMPPKGINLDAEIKEKNGEYKIRLYANNRDFIEVLRSNKFFAEEGETVTVTYDITVNSGTRVALSPLNTRGGDNLILNEGTHTETVKWRVLERKVKFFWSVYAGATSAAPPEFTIRKFNIEKKKLDEGRLQQLFRDKERKRSF